MQTRRQSLVEALAGFSIGILINWIIVFATVNLVRDPPIAATLCVILCSVHSLVRTYGLRRWFAHREGEAPR